MTNPISHPPYYKVRGNNVDNIVCGSGGMFMVKLAQNLPESNIYKSWLIILAPAITLFCRYLWNQISEEIAYIKFK